MALVMLLALGCGSGKDDGPAARPAEIDPDKRAQARTCLQAHRDFYLSSPYARGELAMGTRRQLVCAELYSSASCPTSWLVDGGTREVVEAMVRRCTSSYCEVLGKVPSLCRRGRETFKPRDLITALVELDAAILAHELGDARLAGQLAERLRVLNPMSLELELPPEPTARSGGPERVYISDDGQVTFRGRTLSMLELSNQVEELKHQQPGLEIDIYAGVDVAYERVIDVMTAITDAGVSNIRFRTR